MAPVTKGKKKRSKFVPPPPANTSSISMSQEAGPSKIHIDPPQQDSELEPLEESQLCCVCKQWCPPRARNNESLKFINWGQCQFCGHWVHLKFCTKEVALRRNVAFLCIHCKED